MTIVASRGGAGVLMIRCAMIGGIIVVVVGSVVRSSAMLLVVMLMVVVRGGVCVGMVIGHIRVVYIQQRRCPTH